MNSKEKAIDLLNKYSMWLLNSHKEEAKQCALICCDEILSLDINAKSESQFVIERRIEEYWHEVKEEIEKL